MPFEIAGWCLLEAKFGPVCNRRADTEQTPSRHRADTEQNPFMAAYWIQIDKLKSYDLGWSFHLIWFEK